MNLIEKGYLYNLFSLALIVAIITSTRLARAINQIRNIPIITKTRIKLII